MQLLVLGNQAPFPGPGGATPGYLLQQGSQRILLDAGSGVAARLMQEGPLHRLGGVMLSHLHFDHSTDALILSYALLVARRRQPGMPPVPLYLPEEAASAPMLAMLTEVGSFEPVLLSTARSLEIGGLSFSFVRTEHPVPCYGMRISDGQGVLGYTADTSWRDDLPGFFSGCDILLAEATVQEKDKRATQFGHLTAGQAGQLGQQAQVGQLLLTHLDPLDDWQISLAEAGAFFPRVAIAEMGRTYTLGFGR